MNRLIFSFSLISLLLCQSAYAFTERNLYELPQDLKTIFWQRYTHWYNSKLSYKNKKVQRTRNISLKENLIGHRLGYLISFTTQGLESIKIKKLIVKNQGFSKPSDLCEIKIRNIKDPIESCNGKIIFWKRSPCPRKDLLKNYYSFTEFDQCFSTAGMNFSISGNLKWELYQPLWSKVVGPHTKEFAISPNGIFWDDDLKVIRVYYH